MQILRIFEKISRQNCLCYLTLTVTVPVPITVPFNDPVPIMIHVPTSFPFLTIDIPISSRFKSFLFQRNK